jgi:hypothetical protein
MRTGDAERANKPIDPESGAAVTATRVLAAASAENEKQDDENRIVLISESSNGP